MRSLLHDLFGECGSSSEDILSVLCLRLLLVFVLSVLCLSLLLVPLFRSIELEIHFAHLSLVSYVPCTPSESPPQLSV